MVIAVVGPKAKRCNYIINLIVCGEHWRYDMEINIDKSQVKGVFKKNESFRIKVDNRTKGS